MNYDSKAVDEAVRITKHNARVKFFEHTAELCERLATVDPNDPNVGRIFESAFSSMQKAASITADHIETLEDI